MVSETDKTTAMCQALTLSIVSTTLSARDLVGIQKVLFDFAQLQSLLQLHPGQ